MRLAAVTRPQARQQLAVAGHVGRDVAVPQEEVYQHLRRQNEQQLAALWWLDPLALTGRVLGKAHMQAQLQSCPVSSCCKLPAAWTWHPLSVSCRDMPWPLLWHQALTRLQLALKSFVVAIRCATSTTERHSKLSTSPSCAAAPGGELAHHTSRDGLRASPAATRSTPLAAARQPCAA